MNTGRLDELAQKASKINGSQSHEVASLLITLLKETQDQIIVADYIMIFKASVCLDFFEQIVSQIEPEKIELLYDAICATESYKKNANHAATTRGFIIAAVLIKSGQRFAKTVLMRTLAGVEKNGKYSPAAIKVFKDNVIEYCGLNAISALDDGEWEKPYLKGRFLRFMQAVSESIFTVSDATHNEGEEPVLDVANSQTDLQAKSEESVVTPETSTGKLKSSAVEKAHDLSAGLLKMLESSASEARMLLQTLRESNGTIVNLRQQIDKRDLRITELAVTVQERDNQIASLNSRINMNEQEIADKQSRIADLTERLKASLHMDSISQSQEMLTLKTDLANSLKVEYADYLNNKEVECNQDTFAAYRGSLTRIFKTLRRFGITIE